RAVRVNVSIPTDSERVRQVFEPKAPPLERRWHALDRLRDAGLPVGICVTPMLPLEGPESFLQRLLAFRPDVLVTQNFQDSHGRFGADTGQWARRLLADFRWTADDYRGWLKRARLAMDVLEGEAGFFPPSPRDQATSSAWAGGP